MSLLFWVAAVVAGISNPLQSASNAELLKRMEAPVVAAFSVYLVGACCLLLTIPYYGFPARSAVSKLDGAPWWLVIGGVCNALFLMVALTVTKQLGSATFTTLLVISAVVTSVVLDHFGLLGLEVRQVTTLRALGCLLAIAGVVLIARY